MFQLCKDLCIDDPVAWFNAAPPAVVDFWLAYYSVVHEAESGENNMVDPMTALRKLQHGR